MSKFQVGERVCKQGFAWRGEPNLFGVVTKCYMGQATSTNHGLEMVDVRWDGRVEDSVGYLVKSGGLMHVFIVPPVLLPGVKT